MSINEDELRRLAEAAQATVPPEYAHEWYPPESFDKIVDWEEDKAFLLAANPTAVLALLDLLDFYKGQVKSYDRIVTTTQHERDAAEADIAALRQELRTVIDADNALVQRQRQELDAAKAEVKRYQALIDSDFNATKALLIELRHFMLRHDAQLGECVAWMKLKKLFDVGQTRDADEAWLAAYQQQATS